MRTVSADSRAGAHNTNALETINAAATAIASAESRAPQATVQKRRWGSCWSVYWCFGYQRQKKRIGHAVLFPDPSAPGNGAPAAENPPQVPAIVLPFAAPPSSPASFFQSEPPSATQSPAGLLSLTSVSASMYSPSGPASIFAIGPYAHETQLVSPPVFSTFTTEPSTAPFTPPPESVHLTTPSSPEVPFAQLLDPSLRNSEAGQRFPLSSYEFQSYQLYPGSPVGQLISPSSGISGSGTSSPFPDGEFTASGPNFLQFRMGVPPTLLNLDKLSSRDWGSRQGSGTITPDSVRPTSGGFLLDRQYSDVALHSHSDNAYYNNTVVEHRVSFELTTEDDPRCLEQKQSSSVELVLLESAENEILSKSVQKSSEPTESQGCHVGETSDEQPEKDHTDSEGHPRHQKHRSLTLGSLKEFDFNNADGRDSQKPNIGSDWWANGGVIAKEGVATKDWSFPMIQHSVS